MKFTGPAPRILDFDTESRPLSWINQDFVSSELTAIAAQFIGESKMHVWALGEASTEEMLEGFCALYAGADIVTGHYIRGHDLPRLQALLVEFGLPLLGPKLTSDTKGDLLKFGALSKSQEALGAMFGLNAPKVKMDQAKWREANRLTPKGIRLTKARVSGDVRQHMELRAELLRRGMLGPAKVWLPQSSSSRYAP